jgi:predicted PurR-regulated permease PerM
MPSSYPPASGWQRALAMVGTMAILVLILWWAQRLFVMLTVAVLIAFVLEPIVRGLERRGLKRGFAVILTTLFTAGILGSLGWLVGVQIRAMSKSWPEYQAAIERKVNAVDPWGERVLLGKLSEVGQELVGLIPQAIAPLLETLLTIVFIVILVAFALMEWEDLRTRVLRLLGSERRPAVTTRAIDEASKRISRYLLMMVTINASYGIVLAVVLLLFKLPYAPLWGTIAALMRFVPYVGAWISLVLPILFSLATAQSWFQPLAILATWIVLEILTANVLEPLLYGKSAGLSPMAVLVAAIFWGWLWGPIGLILSTPLTVCLLVLGRYVAPLKFLETILGDEIPVKPHVRYYQRILAHDQDEAVDMIEERLANHDPIEVMDQVIIPALVLAKKDRQEDELRDEDEHLLIRVTHEILASLETATAPSDQDAGRVRILAYPASDEIDELALAMLPHSLSVSPDHLQTMTVDSLSSDVLTAIDKDSPALVIIVSLPEGGLAQTRYLSKRLRARFPDLPILIGRWGLTENQDQVRKRLLASGASDVSFTLDACRTQAVPMIQHAAHAAPQKDVSRAS